MCVSLTELLEDERKAGMDLLGRLNLELIHNSRYDDLEKVQDNAEYREQLLIEFGLI